MNRKPRASKLDDFLDHGLHRPLSRRLSVRAPHRAERTVLGAPAHRLHRRPHVLPRRQQVPPRGLEHVARHAARLVDALGRPRDAVVDDRRPHEVAVTAHHRSRAAEFERLLGEQGRVDAAEHHVGPALTREAAHLVPSQGVAGVDADADDVAGGDCRRIEQLEGFVAQDGVAPLVRCRGCEYEEPPRRDDGDAERHVAGVHEMDAQ